jgi:hypothetical protein
MNYNDIVIKIRRVSQTCWTFDLTVALADTYQMKLITIGVSSYKKTKHFLTYDVYVDTVTQGAANISCSPTTVL